MVPGCVQHLTVCKGEGAKAQDQRRRSKGERERDSGFAGDGRGGAQQRPQAQRCQQCQYGRFTPRQGESEAPVMSPPRQDAARHEAGGHAKLRQRR